jgi:hypothetical protein
VRENFFLVEESGVSHAPETAKRIEIRQSLERAEKRKNWDKRCGAHECWMKSMTFGECSAGARREASNGRTAGKRLEVVN